MKSFVRMDTASIPLEQLRVSGIYRPDPTPAGLYPGAILPAADSIRTVDDELLESVVADSDTPASALIELLDPPDNVLAAAQQWAFADPGDPEAQRALTEAGLEFEAEYIGRRASAGDMLTTTVNLKLNVFAGLHVDNRDNKPLVSRLESRQRIGINPGPGMRWLLACLPDIVVMSNGLGYKKDYLPSNPNGPFGKFVDKRPHDVKCLWVPVPPGVAYRAPTDCMGHDVSTLGASEESATVMYLGDWALGAWTQPEKT
jgi:hypothetical protein